MANRRRSVPARDDPLNQDRLRTVRALNVIFVLLAILGNEFIRRRDRRGWFLWLPSNVIALVFFGLQRQWWTVALYAYFTVAAMLAIREWRRREQKEASGGAS